MKHSCTLIGAFLSGALLAACSGNNALPSAGSFSPSGGSFVSPGMINAPLLGLGAGSRLPHLNPSRIAQDQTVPDRGDGHLIPFDDPDAGGNGGSVCTGNPFCGTTPQANNDDGTVVGYYTNGKYVVKAFIRWASGDIENFSAPGASSEAGQGTYARSINHNGWIAGQYQDSNGVYHGFVRKPDGTITPYDYPSAGSGAGQGTQTFDINDRGETAGNYIDSSGVNHGWVCLHQYGCKNFDAPPSSVFMLVCEATCLNSNGTVVGFYFESGYLFHGFTRYRDGRVRPINVKGAGPKGTIVQSINNHGDIAGGYYDSSNVERGFILKHEGMWSEKLITFEAPWSKPGGYCANGTQAYAINDYDATTGLFPNSTPTLVGFFRSSSGHFSKITAGSSSGPCQGTQPNDINNKDEVTGWFTPAHSRNHGFVWTPDRS